MDGVGSGSSSGNPSASSGKPAAPPARAQPATAARAFRSSSVDANGDAPRNNVSGAVPRHRAADATSGAGGTA
ncbi:MAG TPA: hypothetical protein EYM25_08140 [Deltaproteobacteria bacterium]|nr:hypothetical protein [Deltaproteobacteria bacterium]